MAKFDLKVCLSSTAMIGALLSAAPAIAQQAPAPEGEGLDEIVVTAERREASVQNTAQAISAVSAETLEQSGVFSAAGLAQVVPGVDVHLGGGFSQVRVRGVGGGVVNNFGEPGVAYNIAGVYLAQPYGGNAAYHDLQRVEVLKGPQGTLYGRNSTAGAINIVPNRPDLSDFYGKASLQLGNYEHVETQLMLNAPLAENVAARIAVSTINHDGYFSNGQSDAEIGSGRLQLLFEPSERVSLLLLADYFSEGGSGPGDTPLFPGTNLNGVGAISPGATGRYLNPDDPWDNLGGSFSYPTGFPAPNDTVRPYASPSIDHEQLILSAELEVDLGFATLSLIPSYVTTKVDDNLANFAYTSDVFTDAKQTSLEARLASNGDGALEWVAGFYYFDQDANSSQTFLQRGRGYITLGTPELTATSYALFGQASYALTDQFRLTGGLRYTEEEKSVRGATVAPGVPAFLCPNFVPATGTGYGVTARCAVPNVGDLSFNATNWKVGVEYDIRDDSLLYAHVSTGFRAGGFNPGSPPNTFPPEELTAYEIGSRNEFFDRRLRLNASAFYWDYGVESNPVFGPINPVGFGFVVVPGSSHVQGVEIETAARLTEVDTVTFNVLYQDAKYDQYSTLAIPLLGVPATVFDGTRRSNSPELSGNASYEHVFQLTGGGEVSANANMHFESASILNLARPLPEGYERDGYMTGNVSLTYHSANEKFSIGAFVNNVSDEFVPTYAFTSTTTGHVFQQAQPPRTYGIRTSVNF